jgi:hypothetical protein
MKLLKFGVSLSVVLLLSFSTISCSEKKSEDTSKEAEVKNKDGHESGEEATAESHDMSEEQMDHSAMDMGNTKKSNAIVASYLQLKNALVDDKSKEAGVAAEGMLKAFKAFDASGLNENEQKEIGEILENAIEQAEHITKNVGNMEHQREHLEVLSNDMIDFLAIVGSEMTLYQTRCPMYNKGKGGIWLSETEEIRNPFYGSKMLTCGAVQKEI